MTESQIQRDPSMYPNVSIARLDDLAGLAKSEESKVRLGGGRDKTGIEQKYNALLNQAKQNSENAFILAWEGNKIPRGAEIAGKKIAWTQNGVVTADDGSIIGTYDRVTEWGGKSGKEQSMVVFVPRK